MQKAASNTADMLLTALTPDRHPDGFELVKNLARISKVKVKANY